MLIYRNSIILTFITLWFCVGELAWGANIYTVEDIQVSSSGSDAKQARDSALSKGEAQAYQEVLARVTPEFTIHYQAEVSPQDISALVEGYNIKDEKVTPNHYQATVSMTFSRPLMRRHLENLGLSYIDTQSAPVVVIPVLYDQNNRPVIDNNNIWQAAWAKTQPDLLLLKLVLPDWNEVTKNISDDKEGETIADFYQDVQFQAELAKQYRAEYILLAEAKLVQNSAVSSLVFTSTQFSKIGSVADKPFVITETFQSEEEESSEVMLVKRVSSTIAAKMENEWKLQRGYEKFSTTNLRVKVPINDGLKEWQSFYKRLSGLDFISNISIESLAVSQAELLLTFSISYRELQERLLLHDLHFEKENNELLLFYEKKAIEAGDEDNLPGFLRQLNTTGSAGTL